MIANAKDSGEEVRLMMFPAGHWASPVVDIMTKGVRQFYSSTPWKITVMWGYHKIVTNTFMCPLISADLAASHRKIMIEEKQP